MTPTTPQPPPSPTDDRAADLRYYRAIAAAYRKKADDHAKLAAHYLARAEENEARADAIEAVPT